MNTAVSSSISERIIEKDWKEFSGRLIQVSSALQVPREQAWEELKKCSLLKYVSHGKTSFWTLPETWKVGEEVLTDVKTKVFGCIPITTSHTILFTDIDDSAYTASTQESNKTIPIWDHSMSMQEDGDSTIYTDEIAIYSGMLTWIVAAQTRDLYMHRHMRWQQVVDILNKWEFTDDTQHLI